MKTIEGYKTLVDATVERETEKAMMVDITFDSQLGLKGRKMWFPKSQTEVVDGAVMASAWIICQKEQQLRDEVTRGSFVKILTA